MLRAAAVKVRSMSELQAPDTHHLSSAIGWLELGNHHEARVELAKLAAELHDHPDVLEVQWQICSADCDWEAGLTVAHNLLNKAPERYSGWIFRAYALRRVKSGGLEKAWAALQPAFEKFPKISIIPFNLSCYAAQSGQLDQAWEWLHKAMEAEGDVGRIKQQALADSDLQPLWERIREL